VQGLIGTSIGLIIGSLLALFTSWYTYGHYAFTYLPTGSVVARGGIALLFGFLLSVLGAWYPAKVAANMEPAVAMSTNE